MAAVRVFGAGRQILHSERADFILEILSDKDKRVRAVVSDYLEVARGLSVKVRASLLSLCDQEVDVRDWELLAYFHGKTYVACALGHQACREGHRTCYYPAAKLFRALETAQADGSLPSFFKRLARSGLLVVDDFGLAGVSGTASSWKSSMTAMGQEPRLSPASFPSPSGTR